MSEHTLPPGWANPPISDCCDLNPRLDKSQFSDERLVHFVPMPAVEALTNKIDVSATRTFTEVKKGYTPFAGGDVLFAKITPCMENGKMVVVPELTHGLAFGSTEFHVIRPGGGLDPLWFFHFLSSRSYRSNAQNNMTGAVGQRRVPIDYIAQSTIPLPPLSEQKRIVAKIEVLFSELEAGEASLRQARRQLGVYRQSLLKQAFEGKLTENWRTQNPDKLESPADLLARIQSERQARYKQRLMDWEHELNAWETRAKIDKRPAKPRRTTPPQLPTTDQIENLPDLPNTWSWISVGNCAVEISDGPFGSNLKSNDYVGSGVRVVRLENIGPGRFIEEKESFISIEKYEKLKRHTVRPGDIIVASFINDAVRAALIPSSIEYAINKADCFQIHCFSNTLSADFLVRCFGARYFFKQLEQLVHGVGRPRINTTQLGEAFVPLCSLPEQQEIVRLLDAQFEVIEQNERELDAALQRSEALRQSILKKAFAGQLVLQDPTDEPASALLARIRAERDSSTLATKRKSARQP